MRLIDKDNLRKPSKGMFIYQDEFEDDVQHVAFEAYTKDDIEREPTVEAIPIELYEQIKGERDVAIEQLKSLNVELFEKPYRKAIPIEYIEKFKKEFRAVASVKAVIEWLLENWEKENEKG